MSTRLRLIMMILMVVTLLAGTGMSVSPAQASGCSAYHTVRHGDSLSSIARWYGAYWPHLAQINHIPGPMYKIFPGQVLCIQTGGYGYYPPTYNPPPYKPPTYYPPTYYPPTYYSPIVTNWSFVVGKVEKNETVTIHTKNFPSNVLFKAKMGKQSGNGMVWKDLPDIDSGKGGQFEVIFDISADFDNVQQLAIRVIQEKKNGKVFQQDQWFSNTDYYTHVNTGAYAPYYPCTYNNYGYCQ